MGLEKVTIFG